jgi:hypothetical protein
MSVTPDPAGEAYVEAVRTAIREQALDRFLSEALTPDARNWVAGFAARAAVALADAEQAALVAERDRLVEALSVVVPPHVVRAVRAVPAPPVTQTSEGMWVVCPYCAEEGLDDPEHRRSPILPAGAPEAQAAGEDEA